MDIGIVAQDGAPVLDRLAHRVATFGEGEVTACGRSLVHAAMADTLGVGLAGAATDPVRILAVALGAKAPGDSLLLGTSDRVNALDAGMLNGVAAHALDFDDGNSLMAGHPSTMLVPAVLALGEELGCAASKVLAGYVAGYEVIVRLSRGINMYHYEKGWHPTSTIGIFGVAAAGARMLGLDPSRTATALGIACSMASGVKANFGTMVKSLHIGHGIRDGLLCAKLAAGGFTANARALEAPQGFLSNFNGIGNFDIAAMLDDVDDALEVNRETNKIKLFACCASTHASVDAALVIRAAHGIQAEKIDRVLLLLHPRRIPHTDRPQLQEALSGKFSQQYLVARAFVDGDVWLRHFEGEAHRDPKTLALMRRVQVRPAPDGVLPHAFAARIEVRLDDGTLLEGLGGRRNAGVTGEEQLNAPEFWSKFEDCARQALPAAKVRALMDALRRFDEFADIRDFTSLLSTGGGC